MANAAFNTAAELKKLGNSIVVIAEGIDGRKLGEENGIPIIFTPQTNKRFPKKLKNWIYSYRANKIVERLIKAGQIDVVNAHCSGMNFYALKNNGKKLSPPVIYTSAGLGFEGNLLLYTEKFREKLKKYSYNLPLTYFSELVSARRADKIVALSNTMATTMEKAFFVPKEEIAIIGEGIEEKRFKKKKIGKMAKEIEDKLKRFDEIILFPNAFSKIKGTLIGLRAFNKIAKKFPRVGFVMVGRGEMRSDAIKFIAENNLQKQVALIDYLPYDEFFKLYFKSDIIIQPSFHDGFSLIKLDTMAAGRALIASRVGAVPDFMTNMENGLVFESKDVEKLAQHMQLLLQNKKLRKRLGENARKTVFERYTWKKIAQQYNELFAVEVEKKKLLLGKGDRKQVAGKMLQSCDTLLDIGCGLGNFALFSKDKAKIICGIDLSLASLKEAKNKGVNAVNGNIDVANLPFKSESFDAAVMLDVIEYLCNPENVLSEASRVLKKNGEFILSTPNAHYYKHLALAVSGKKPKVYGSNGRIRPFTIRELQQLLERNGFGIVEKRGNKRFAPKMFSYGIRIKARKC